MTCFMCKGSLEHKLSTFMIEVDSCIIIIKNVPSLVCDQCGEVSYDLNVSRKLEEILDKLVPIVLDIGVFEYQKLAS
ncbi:MAG: type II toxin-antitoxin system MqsA family antitoxin [Clostridia bacterium]